MNPLLLVDVDGVLNPFCFEKPPEGFETYEMFPKDEEPVLLSEIHGQWLRELSHAYRMVWVTAWGEEANRLISPVFGLPRWPTIPFPPIPFDPAEKVPAVQQFVDDQPCAWIEDNMTSEASDWAAHRQAPTLLISTNPAMGLVKEMVDRLLDWNQSNSQP